RLRRAAADTRMGALDLGRQQLYFHRLVADDVSWPRPGRDGARGQPHQSIPRAENAVTAATQVPPLLAIDRLVVYYASGPNRHPVVQDAFFEVHAVTMVEVVV